MNRQRNRTVVKGAAIILGVLGCFVIFSPLLLSLLFNDIGFWPLYLAMLLMGGLILRVVYQVLFQYSLNAIKTFSATVIFIAYGQVNRLYDPLYEEITPIELAIYSAIGAVVLYKGMVALINRLTLEESG